MRKVYGEYAAFPGGTVDVDSATMELHDMFGDCKAKTCSAK